MSEAALSVQPTASDHTPRVKCAPNLPAPFVYSYSPSDDGTDENLLVLLHGLGELAPLSCLGDTHASFAKLGKQLHLPQTATLSLRAFKRVPYLHEEAYQWYESFDSLGELLERPDPSSALDILGKLTDHLLQECNWPPRRIHIFGFGQGGGLAVEFAQHWWKTRGNNSQLASVISIAGPLLSYPTLPSPCTTPVLIFHRPASEATTLSASDLTSFKKGFTSVREVKGGQGEGMPRSKDEWEGIMRFWSENLNRRQVAGLYEIMSG